MTAPTESERLQAEAAFKREFPKVHEMAELEQERDWGTPIYSAIALRDVFVGAWCAALRAGASPVGEAERKIVTIALAWRPAADSNDGRCMSDCQDMLDAVDALLTLRASSLAPQDDPGVVESEP